MAKEIERKFLVLNEQYKKGIEAVSIRQGFISTDKDKVIRVRIAGPAAFLTLKNQGEGIARNEFEYEIPQDEAREIIEQMCGEAVIIKDRYTLNYEGHTWEVDEFAGDNSGLVLAEIELQHEEEDFVKPPWLGEEVTHDKRYLNAYLAQHPYQHWDEHSG